MGVMEKRRLIALNEPHIMTTTPAGVASFSTDMVAKLKSCKVEFLPVQSGNGDPSPTNIRPITGWAGVTAYRTGKNLIDKTRSAFGTYDQTTGEAISSSYQYQTRIEYDIPVAPGEKIIHSNANNNNGRAFFWKQSGEYVGTQLCTSGTAFTIPSNAGKMRFVSSSDGWATDSNKWQLEKGSTATTYEAYTGISCPVSWTEQGTVYGGYVDVVTGELVATHYLASVAKADFDSRITPSSGGIPYRNSKNLNFPRCASGVSWATARTQQLFNYGKIANPYSEASYGDYIGVMVTQASLGTYLRISNAVYEAMGDNDYAEISYKLETPTAVTTLTPTQIKSLIGTNNIWSNANGNVTVKHWKH